MNYPPEFERWWKRTTVKRKQQAYRSWLLNQSTGRDLAQAQQLDRARRRGSNGG